MTGSSTTIWFDRVRLARIADCLAVAVAVSLPWSTSATSILLVLWLLVLVPTLRWTKVCAELITAAGGLPVVLVVLGVLGMLWADVSLLERWKGLDSFFKLLVIPLLIAQFRNSNRGPWVLSGYLISCLVLLVVTSIVLGLGFFVPMPYLHDNVLVKNAATQSGEFVTCIFGLLFLVIEFYERRQWWRLICALAAVLGMLTNIVYLSTGRTALAVIPVLLTIFATRRLNGKGILVLLTVAVLIGCVGWFSSQNLRDRTTQIWTDFQHYQSTDERNSSGERVEFWKKSIQFVREAPIVGHGTGSIPSLFMRSSIGQTGAAGSATTNPHNQTFAVAIQLGLVGAGVLWAMWIAHLILFRSAGLTEWVGLVVVVQNIVGSLFNSHLFDFTQGWVYVFGIGVAGGMALKERLPN